VETTAIEFRLLTAFIRLRGRVLSREQLLNEVWGQESSPTDRVVDNHIMNLRKKIEATPGSPCYVVSLRGVGYRFDG
jgi:DNA-binding response OmpR family regulator